MTLQQLLYFLAVADTRHFTRAAERAYVAQPSLSKQIRALEDEVGASLFSRARGNITLTAAGEALLPIARRILSDVDTARLEIAELVGLRRGRVRVGATPSLCASLFADVLGRFHSEYPGVELVVAESGSKDLVRALTHGELDLAVLTAPERGEEAALTTTPILRERLVVAAAEQLGEVGADGGAVSLRDLRDRPLVMFREGYDLRDTTLHACRAAGFEPRFAVQGGEMDAVLRFVEIGLGVAIVPSIVVAGRSGIHAAPLRDPEISRTIALAHRTDVAPTHAARAFRATLIAHLHTAALPEGVALCEESG